MSTNEPLTQKEKELVAIGASLAAGCQPCTTYHFQAARAAGAGEKEIRQAVSDALDVRRSATEIMTRIAAKQLEGTPGLETSCPSEKSLIGEFVSISAALAVNCATSLEIHLTAAQRLGATERQIQTVVGLSRGIKNTAVKKADAVIARIISGSQESAGDCGCQPETAKATGESQSCADDCGCQSEAVKATGESQSCASDCECHADTGHSSSTSTGCNCLAETELVATA